MKSSLLLNKIKNIQSQYRDMIKELLKKLQTSVSLEILDNINLFWIRNIDVVRLYLETVSLHSESFVYIASSFIEYNHNEHLPFLLVGSQRILNDELSRYAYLCCNMPKENEIKFLLKQIVKLAENNLKILEDTSENILIFPLDLLVKLREDNILFKVSESLFVNMFNDIKDLNDYFKKCNSFDDIIHYARENFSKGIVFSENDDKSLPIRERFKCVVSEFDFILDSHHTDAYNFYAIVYGNIQQAIQIVAYCLEYGCVPFTNSSVCFHYLFLVMNCLMSVERSFAITRFQMIVGYAIYMSCDINNLAPINIDVFLEKVQEYDFTHVLFSKLEESGVTNDNFSQYSIDQVVTEELQEFYKFLDMND